MTDDREAYWQKCEAYFSREGIELFTLKPFFRAVRIEGVPEEPWVRWLLPHFAVVATKQKQRAEPGNRVELVVRHPYYEALEVSRPGIDEQISGLSWDAPTESNETGHIEVWKPHNLDSRAAWHEDFDWFVMNLRLFQRVLTPYVLRAGGWDASG